MGFNTVCAYLFWNLHEPRPGEFDWSGQADVAEYCRIAQEEGLWVILRPGPYSCAEWEMGGLPWWLLKNEGIKLRTRDPRFLEPAKRYLKEVGRVLAPLQITHGGPILMIQVENEYGAFGADAGYMGELRQALVEAGFSVPLFACNQVHNLRNGFRPDLLPVVNFGSDPEGGFKALRGVWHQGPLMCGEFYPGWFDTWGTPHHVGDLNNYLSDLDYMLRSGASFSIYVAHGGTSFGLWSGADRPFKPDTSSYDYDAPISEAGWATEKFFKTRELFARYLLPGESIPQPPASNRVITIPAVEASECAPIFANLPSPITDRVPRAMEQYNQGQGCILYHTTLPAGPSCTIDADAVHDLGLVFLNGERIGIMDRRNRSFKVRLPERKEPATLDILVEAMGRVNFGNEVADRKGLSGAVRVTPPLDSGELKDWQVFPLPLDAPMLAGLQYGNSKARTPAFWRATVDLSETGDTFLDMRPWGKGVVWVNGRCLGRFWNIGPTQTMYVPGPWLKRGRNEIVILDLIGPEMPVVTGIEQPILDQLQPDHDFSSKRSTVRLTLDSGCRVYAGRFDAGTKLQEVRFAEPVSGRYFSMDTFSAHDDKAFAAIGELDLLDESGVPLSHEGWTVAYVDSEERDREDGSAENAIDGQIASFWHTQWGDAVPNHPHRLILDLGRSRIISGFRYVPRQGDAGAGGRIKDYQVSIGDRLVEEKPPSDLLPEKCFLFSYFGNSDRDGLHLAWSLDGYRWDQIENGRSVLKPALGGANLMRDPCLLRGPDGTFHLVWTAGWTGNTIGHASSKDLVNWSAQQAIPVMADEPGTLNCWAPEVYWDARRQQFLIIWASAVTNRFRETIGSSGETGNQRLYFTTTKDFKAFSPTRLFYDPGFSIIDGTVLQANGRFYLFFKEESSRPPRKNIRMAVSDDILGPYGPAAPSFSPDWVASPAVFRTGGEYVALFHFYMNNGFGAMKSKDLEHWQDASEQLRLPMDSHQGTVLEVPGDLLLSLWRGGHVELGATPMAAQLGVGNWIWTTNTEDKQTCRLWRSFEVPQGTLVSRATLRITADNGYRALLDGQEIGRGGDMNCLTEYDLTRVMSPGTHTLAIEAFNDASSAGVILGLRVELSNGKRVEVLSDPSWRVVPGNERRWETRNKADTAWAFARVVAFAGRQVWDQPDKILVSPPLQPPVARFWQQSWFLFLLLTVCVIGAVFIVRQGLQLAVQSRSQHLLERERDRIARDIHDDLGAGLTQLTLLGELVLRATPRNVETRTQLDALCCKARALLGSMDEIVWAVNPRRDTVHDFAAFVCEHAQEFLSSTSVRCRLDVAEDLPSIPLELPARRNLLLAVKEAVRNAARHSGASELLLQMRVADQQLHVIVEDNGRGFQPETARASRNGLHNMNQRLADIGGTCHVTSSPGKGCRIAFTLPIHSTKLATNWLSLAANKLWPTRKPTERDP